MGWTVADRDGRRIAGISSGQPCASSVMRLVPDEGFAVAVVTNRDLVSLDDLVDQLGVVCGGVEKAAD